MALVAGGLLQFAGVLGSPGSGGATAPAVPAAVEAEIAALKSEIAALKAGAGNAGNISGTVDGLSQALDQVKADVASLQQAVEAGRRRRQCRAAGAERQDQGDRDGDRRPRPGHGGRPPAEIAAINEKIAGVEALAKAAGEAGTVVDGRLGALEQSLSALVGQGRRAGRAAQDRAGDRRLGAQVGGRARRAVPAEIETFAAIAPDAPELAELRAYAEKGVATRADILAETDAAANAMIAAAKPADAECRLLRAAADSAESLVTVRPIGAVEGAGVPETVARMEVALKAGDLAKAIAEFDTLPEAAKAAGAAFADKIRARLDVEKLVDQAIAAAMKA